jgi:hypothetical protein
MKIFKKEKRRNTMSWKLVAGGETLRDQVNKRWPKRDKRSDGAVGDLLHQARRSDHNPDSKGQVHAIDIDEDLRGSKNDNIWFADQLIAYARTRKGGSSRLKYVVYENEIASGTYANHFWVWRGDHYGHEHHIHVSFTTQGESDGMRFDIPILVDGQNGLWDGKVPFFDVLQDAIKSGSANKATWRLACRLKELGFYSGAVQSEGVQKYPKNAVRAMQDYMGWSRREYDAKTHKAIWKRLTLKDPEG